MSSVLITGGAGFIGSHLAEKLLESGERVVVFDDLNNSYSQKIKRDNISKGSESSQLHFCRRGYPKSRCF